MTTNRAGRQAPVPSELPDFDRMLQFSLWLSKNGRSATWSLQDVIAEGNRYCHDWMPMSNRENWLRNATASHNTNASKVARDSGSTPKNNDAGGDHTADRGIATATYEDATRSVDSSAGELDSANHAKAIARLPDVFRSAMILSELEGFSYRDIAALAGVTPKLVAGLLLRGRQFLLKGIPSGLTSSNVRTNA